MAVGHLLAVLLVVWLVVSRVISMVALWALQSDSLWQDPQELSLVMLQVVPLAKHSELQLVGALEAT